MLRPLCALLLPVLAADAAAQATAGGFLATVQNQLREFDAAGALLATSTIPHPAGVRPPTERVRDLVVHPDGDVWVFNGTFSPWLSVRRAASGQWSHWSHPQWAATNGGSNGGIAIFDDDVWVAGDQTAFVPGALLRFDTATSSFVVFGTQFSQGFIDLAFGWDGLLYALSQSEQDVMVFQPATLQHVRTIALPHAIGARGLGVAADGTLLVATWQQGLRRFDAKGTLVQSLATGSQHHDLDLGPCGEILCGDWQGRVLQSTAALTASTLLPTGATGNTFTAFRTPQVPAPARAIVREGTPANPLVFLGGGALLGSTWSGTLTPFLPGAIADVVVFGAGPANVPSPLGTLLFDEVLTHFVYDATAGGTISVAIPNHCQLTGVTFVAQAGSVSLATVALANALDVRISSF